MNPQQIQQLTQQYPIVKTLIELKETIWFNPDFTTLEEGLPYVGLNQAPPSQPAGRLVEEYPSTSTNRYHGP